MGQRKGNGEKEMTETIGYGCLVLSLVLLILLVLQSLGQGKKTKDWQQELSTLRRDGERLERLLREEMALSRGEFNRAAGETREELMGSFHHLNNANIGRVAELAELQERQLEQFAQQMVALTTTNENKLEHMRQTVEKRLRILQEDNGRRLEQMRITVDEKLQSSLERRLGESFRQVSERLEQVHQGLGEMQNLAAGVGDLKRIFTNVKTRGIWGEIQLGNLLDQVLTPEQYEKNVAVKKGGERVEFALKLPGGEGEDGVVWLPMDAKFPVEDYQRMLDCLEQSDAQGAEASRKLLSLRIKAEAKSIRDKYIAPPLTTDFAILFLPVEGLYAETLQFPGLCETLQRDYRVVVAGPTTLAALLNSLQMGFRTLAVEKRSSEVWALLGAVKTEFIQFGLLLDKTGKKLQEASNTIESAASKSRAIQRKLKQVQQLPTANVEEEEEDS